MCIWWGCTVPVEDVEVQVGGECVDPAGELHDTHLLHHTFPSFWNIKKMYKEKIYLFYPTFEKYIRDDKKHV